MDKPTKQSNRWREWKDVQYTVVSMNININGDGSYTWSDIPAPEHPDRLYPSTAQYEFYDENGDLLSNQEKYTSILSFPVGEGMRNKIGKLSVETLDHYLFCAERDFEKIKNKINENTKGKFELLDFYMYYEIKGTYAIVYFQYRLKNLMNEKQS